MRFDNDHVKPLQGFARPASAQGCAHACRCLHQRRDLGFTAHKARQAPHHRCLQAPTDRTGADQLEHLYRLRQPLHRDRSQGVHLHQALDQPQSRGRQQDTARASQLFHARRQVYRLSNG
jgi:anaerobic selenocysteine-containing dehydrogenase